MEGSIIDWLGNYLTKNNFEYRHHKNKITLLNSENIGIYQIRIDQNDEQYLVHLIQIKKAESKKTHTSSHSTFLAIPRKTRLFTVDLHDKESIPKIERWLKEIQAKLK